MSQKSHPRAGPTPPAAPQWLLKPAVDVPQGRGPGRRTPAQLPALVAARPRNGSSPGRGRHSRSRALASAGRGRLASDTLGRSRLKVWLKDVVPHGLALVPGGLEAALRTPSFPLEQERQGTDSRRARRVLHGAQWAGRAHPLLLARRTRAGWSSGRCSSRGPAAILGSGDGRLFWAAVQVRLLPIARGALNGGMAYFTGLE